MNFEDTLDAQYYGLFSDGVFRIKFAENHFFYICEKVEYGFPPS